jgi:hypothetical protein
MIKNAGGFQTNEAGTIVDSQWITCSRYKML